MSSSFSASKCLIGKGEQSSIRIGIATGARLVRDGGQAATTGRPTGDREGQLARLDILTLKHNCHCVPCLRRAILALSSSDNSRGRFFTPSPRTPGMTSSSLASTLICLPDPTATVADPSATLMTDLVTG